MYKYSELRANLFLPTTVIVGDLRDCEGYLVPNAEDVPFSYSFPLLQYNCKAYARKSLDGTPAHTVFLSITSVDDSGVSVFFPSFLSREEANSRFDVLVTYLIDLQGRMPSINQFKEDMQRFGGYADVYY